MTPSLVSPEVYEISDISSSHIVDPEEDIQTSIFEEKFSFHPTQSFSCGYSILNYVQSLSVKAQGVEEKNDPLSPIMLLVCRKVIIWMFWKKCNILGVIHSPSFIYFFQQIPT